MNQPKKRENSNINPQNYVKNDKVTYSPRRGKIQLIMVLILYMVTQNMLGT